MDHQAAAGRFPPLIKCLVNGISGTCDVQSEWDLSLFVLGDFFLGQSQLLYQTEQMNIFSYHSVDMELRQLGFLMILCVDIPFGYY